MSTLKICVYAICKNEAKFVDQWMDSMNEADVVVVTDTGSDDDTVEKLRKRGAVVYVDKVCPWRFDTARNISLDHVPEDVDVCVCTDLDELFEPGWRASLEAAWKNYKPKTGGPIAKSGRYLYNWSLKPDGTPDVQFHYFKVHERQNFRWKCPVHEYVQYVGALPLEAVFIEGMVPNHHPDPAKSRGSYLPLLELAVQEAPLDERMRYYLGREYMYKEEWQKCIDTLKAYLAMPTAHWNEERCAAMRWAAKACHKLGRAEDAYGWYYKAIAEASHMRDPYVEFAKMCYELSDWHLQNRYEIYAHWRHRYPDGVTHNTEHVFGLRLPAPLAVTLEPREHLRYDWLPWEQAAERCFSWSNVEAIRQLPRRSGAARH